MRAGADLLIAEDPEDFASSVLSLLGDRAAAERLGATGRATIRRQLDPVRAAELLRAAMAGDARILLPG